MKSFLIYLLLSFSLSSTNLYAGVCYTANNGNKAIGELSKEISNDVNKTQNKLVELNDVIKVRNKKLETIAILQNKIRQIKVKNYTMSKNILHNIKIKNQLTDIKISVINN